ncbi:hypothetical protein [Aquimarina aggregata]|uniref:hypothetical protein n=1 Tax=Aquimarina aggregata TaxID=1642818 RepID=UPI0024933F81|nr:hypothetical protein [Aquimarina aggregata]
MLVLKGLIIFNLGYITYQDIKSRTVYWFLFPTLMLLLGYLHYSNTQQIQFLTAIAINITLVLAILAILYLYTVLKIKRPFFKEVFGLGDGLFFLAIALAFPTISFIILFVSALIFSLVTWLVLKNKALHKTIPLAGYMSAFLLFIFIGNWTTNTINLYLI